MVDRGGITPNSIKREKWENFEEKKGSISDHIQSIQVFGRQALNNIYEHSESRNGQPSLGQQEKYLPHMETGIKGSELKENLDEKSENEGEALNTTEFSLKSIDPMLDVAVSTDLSGSESDLGLKQGVSAGKLVNLSTTETDGVDCQINEELETSRESQTAANSRIGNSSIAASTSKWTTFEDKPGKDSVKNQETTLKEGNSEHSLKTAADEAEIQTPLLLDAMTSKMSAFDSIRLQQAAATADMISNLPVTDPKAVKTDSTSFNQGTNVNTSLNEENVVKSAVPFVSNNKAKLNVAEQFTTVHHTSGKPELAMNWVRFGDEGNSNVTQQKLDSSVILTNESHIGKLETTDTGVSSHNSTIGGTIGDDMNQTSSTVSCAAEEKTTSVIPPVSFTSDELDLLASKSWIKFDDSTKTTNVQQPTSSSAGEEWVTFGDSSSKVGQNLDLLELDVGVKPTSSNVPSPNPFIRATPPSGSNPFKPPTSNPFQADKVDSASITVTSHTAVNKGPILSSTPLMDAKPFLVSESVNIAQPATGSEELAIVNTKLVSSSVNKSKPIQEQVDTMPLTSGIRQQTTQENGKLLFVEKPVANGSWAMLLRFPDKKRKIGSRVWKPVVVKLEGTTVQIFEEYELSAPFREIPLQAYFVMTAPKLQSFEHGAKVHTVKLEYVKYIEGRSLRHRGTVEHISQGTPIIKIASPSHTVIRELIQSFNNSLRLLPAYRDRGITYRHDEVFVDVDDVTYVLMSGDGTILRKNAKVIIKLRAFLTGDPECQLVLNDVVVREREEARLRGELKPQRVHHWVKLRQCDFHKCVNVTTFEQSHTIMFHPLDACTFELMRFPVDHKKPLPLLVKAKLTIHSEQRVELKAEIQVCQDTKMAKYVRSNVAFRFPIPESWVPLFRTGRVFRGETSIKSSKGRRAAGIKSRLKHSKCSIGVSLGKAMYEPEYGSVVWRIDQLPYIHSKIPADAPQTLSVVLDLPPGMEFPESYKPTAELEYEVAYVLVSDTTVIAVKVSNQNIPDKWVCYRALYFYKVNIDISRPSSGPVRDVGCIQQ